MCASSSPPRPRTSAATSEPVVARAASSGPPEDPRAARLTTGRATRASPARSGGKWSRAPAARAAMVIAGVSRPNQPRPTRTERRDGSSRGRKNCSVAGTVNTDRRRPPAWTWNSSEPGRCGTSRPSRSACPASSDDRQSRGAGASAGAGHADGPRHEVPDVHGRGGADGVRGPKRQSAGEVARDVVVAGSGQQDAAGVRRLRPVLPDDGAEEGSLARGVDVVGTGGHRGLDGGAAPAGERSDRRDEHVTALHQSSHRGRRRGLGDLDSSGPPGPPSSAREPAQAVAVRPASTGRTPAATSARAVRSPVYPVAPNSTIRPGRADGRLATARLLVARGAVVR